MDIYPIEIEGDPELLRTKVSGDWVYRQGVPDEQMVRSLEAILQRILRRQQKNGSIDSTLTQRGKNFEAVVAGQHHVEDHHVERLGVRQVESFLAGMRDTHRVVVGFEALPQRLGHLLLVLDHQDMHVPFIGGDSSPPQLTRS